MGKRVRLPKPKLKQWFVDPRTLGALPDSEGSPSLASNSSLPSTSGEEDEERTIRVSQFCLLYLRQYPDLGNASVVASKAQTGPKPPPPFEQPRASPTSETTKDKAT